MLNSTSGSCTTIGLRVSSQDDAESIKWYRLAAEQGLAMAQVQPRAQCTTIGEGVLKDDAEAVRWYRLSSDQGNATAQNNLGLSYDIEPGRLAGRC